MVEYTKKYREENKEAIAEKQKEYHMSKKDQISARKKEYYKNNLDKIRQRHQRNKDKIRIRSKLYMRKYRQENVPKRDATNLWKLREKRRIYRLENKEKIQNSRKIYTQANSEKVLICAGVFLNISVSRLLPQVLEELFLAKERRSQRPMEVVLPP